ncbi:MAG: nuclear transport factor 2 family protein [Chitinophagaceae bacterium]|nr:nuclear transport factor 2 family protein [Chitinophagaceae bacterium]
MNEQQIAAALDEMISIVAAGDPMAAYDKFYHEDLERTDLDGIAHSGKVTNEKIGRTALSKITAIRDFTALGKIVKGNRSFLVWSVDYDHADHGKIAMTEVAIQDWQDGKIIKEKFVA